MTALIIGAAGFVGPYLSSACQRNLNCHVIATKMKGEHLTLPTDNNHTVCITDLDIMDNAAVFELLKQYCPDYIFHLAAQSSVAYSWRNPGLTVDVNIKGALNVLEAIRKMENTPRTLIIGSGEEYGRINKVDIPIKETQCLRPGNIYAATKACQNMISTIYAKAYGLNVVMTRSFNHIGPNQAPIFVVSDFCYQVSKIEKGEQEPVIRVGNLSAKRDFTDVRDVVNAYTSLIRKGIAGETYNIGSGKAMSIKEILSLILAQSKVDIDVEVDKGKLRPIDVPIIEADNEKIVRVTAWKPKISITETIRDMLTYWRAKD